ncbi:type I-F CRISPR-associated endoribonuclease Cas6/Csy4 [Colwellia maritima]|uniref:type I-F CRISPR-associated endoribonuclease Cas6/Csy4 n=1 Tax=Colwellia maritima TaxID=2912588 RepID=UPI003B848562
MFNTPSRFDDFLVNVLSPKDKQDFYTFFDKWARGTELERNEDEQLKLPFINVISLSKNEQFRLFIDQKKVGVAVVVGEFTCYGHSTEATFLGFSCICYS